MSDNKNNTLSLDELSNLSDEELLNLPTPDFPDIEEDESPNPVEEQDEDLEDEEDTEDLEVDEVDEEEEELEESNDANDTDEDFEDEDDSDITDEDSNEASPEKSSKEEVDASENESEAPDAPKKEKPSNDTEKETVDSGVDFKAEYNKIFAPFKANGKQFKAENAEHVIKLMQLGSNYNFKMAKLKPALRVIKTLENHSLLDETKINWLIDLSKKDPKAINQLIKDSGIDPLEVDIEKETGYKPTSYQASEAEINVDQVLDDIQHTDSYPQTVKIIGEQWDEASRQALVKNPTEITHINDQVASGIYKQIMDKVDYYRTLGELQGFSDYDAYRTVGSYMTQNKLFNGSTNQQQPTQVSQDQISGSVAVPDQGQDTKQNSKLKDRKKAAGNTSVAPKPKGTKAIPDYENLSDEEFNKLPPPKI